MKVEIKWIDVFDCKKLFPNDFYQCQIIVRKVMYPYMLFNDKVYSVFSGTPSDPLCYRKDLLV